MDHITIIKELNRNKLIFRELLAAIPKEQYMYKPSPEKWNMLEVVCHLNDEEREDFRLRTRQVLEDPNEALPSFNPVAWVKDRNYIAQNYDDMLDKFLEERQKSIIWLEDLKNPDWSRSYIHPNFGAMSAGMFLSNWLAHDYLHLRQMIKLKFDYFQTLTNENLNYAGTW